MNNTQKTLLAIEQINAQAAEYRKQKVIQILQSLISGSDNEIVKSAYENALSKVREGWPC